MAWINWTWTNPTNVTDFAGVQVFLDGLLKQTTTSAYYNASFAPGTTHEIGTRTIDTTGNVNTTWVNMSNGTLPNTPTGR